MSTATVTIATLTELRIAVRMKYGDRFLSNAAAAYGVDYTHLSHVLYGRLRQVHIVAALQDDFDLSDEQVLRLWPLLKHWPKEERLAS